MDVGSIEKVEADLNAFIERRAEGAKHANDVAALERSREKWRRQRQRDEVLWDRLHYHQAMLEAHTQNFEALLRRHRVGLRLVEEALGITSEEGDSAA